MRSSLHSKSFGPFVLKHKIEQQREVVLKWWCKQLLSIKLDKLFTRPHRENSQIHKSLIVLQNTAVVFSRIVFVFNNLTMLQYAANYYKAFLWSSESFPLIPWTNSVHIVTIMHSNYDSHYTLVDESSEKLSYCPPCTWYSAGHLWKEDKSFIRPTKKKHFSISHKIQTPWPMNFEINSIYWDENPNKPGLFRRVRLDGGIIRITWMTPIHCYQHEIYKIKMNLNYCVSFARNKIKSRNYF